MRTQIIDDKTYVVGDLTLQVDDTLTLMPDEAAKLKSIHDLNFQRLDLQQALMTMCLKTERNYMPEMTDPSVKIAEVTLEMSYKMNELLHTIFRRVGGMLPLIFDDNYDSIKIRMKNPEEDLNYTTKFVRGQVGYDRFEDIVTLMKATGAKAETEIDLSISLNQKYGLQPVVLSKAVSEEEIVNGVKSMVEKKSGIAPMVIFLGGESINPKIPGPQAIFLLEDARQPKRIGNMLEVSKDIKPKTVIVIRAGQTQQSNPNERTTNIWICSAGPNGEKTRKNIPITMTIQPRSVVRGDTVIGKFEPGAQYEDFIVK